MKIGALGCRQDPVTRAKILARAARRRCAAEWPIG
jgi:hypothetical protein